jgi:hypothetical protein
VGITNIRADRLEYVVLPLEGFENTAEDYLQLSLSIIRKFFLCFLLLYHSYIHQVPEIMSIKSITLQYALKHFKESV